MMTVNGRKYETYHLYTAKDTDLYLLVDTVTGMSERTNADDVIILTASQTRKLVRAISGFAREGGAYTLDHHSFIEEGR